MDTFQEQLSSSYSNLVDKLTDWLNAVILQLPNFAIAILVGVAAYYTSRYIKRGAVKGVSKFTNNKTVLNLTSNLTAVIFSAVVLFVILTIFNLGGTINKILATAGVLGLAVGLALQDPMNNLFSGVFMSVKELYQIGDLIETNDYFGTISNIDLRVTTLMLPTGQQVIIPNKDVLQNPLKNYSSSGKRRVEVECGVSYGDDLEKVEHVVRETIAALSAVKAGEPVDVVYHTFGDSSINFTARFWIDTGGESDFLVERSNAIKAIKTGFEKHDIMIPFPIRTLDFGVKGGVPMSKMLSRTERGHSQKADPVASGN